jgi:hypothetical protein
MKRRVFKYKYKMMFTIWFDKRSRLWNVVSPIDSTTIYTSPYSDQLELLIDQVLKLGQPIY